MLLSLALLACSAAAKQSDIEYFVSAADGNDSNPGTVDKPFQTVGRCVAQSEKTKGHGTVCSVRPGVYRESIAAGSSFSGTTIRRAPKDAGDDGVVELSGLQKLDLKWSLSNDERIREVAQGCVYEAELTDGAPQNFEQMFFNRSMMVEARWPNIDVNDVPGQWLSRATWAPASKGTQYGKMINTNLSDCDFSWDGGLAILNVAHQWWTWTRAVSNHTAGSDTFNYPKNLAGLAYYENQPTWSRWALNQFVLVGKLEALDAPGEWHLEQAATANEPAKIRFWAPGCVDPSSGSVEAKVGTYGLNITEAVHINLDGLQFFGTSLNLKDVDNSTMNNLNFLYPTYNRDVPEENPNGTIRSVPGTAIEGSFNTASNISLRYSINKGLSFSGDDSTLTNCYIESVSWVGTLRYVGLSVFGQNINVTRCTVHEAGNVAVTLHTPEPPPGTTGHQIPPYPYDARHRVRLSYSDIYRAGLIGKDTAALYTGEWTAAGNIWHHNWIHDTSEKCVRADDVSQNLTVHHCVIWNCGMPTNYDFDSDRAGLGLVLKGNGHTIYSNTIIKTNNTELCLPSCPDPNKAWNAKHYPYEKAQNSRSQVFNTVAKRAQGSPCSCNSSYLPFPGGNISAVFNKTDPMLVDPENNDFRPAQGSPLIDAGVVYPPYTDGFVGSAPDIGAYEYGGEKWVPGCIGLPGCPM